MNAIGLRNNYGHDPQQNTVYSKTKSAGTHGAAGQKNADFFLECLNQKAGKRSLAGQKTEAAKDREDVMKMFRAMEEKLKKKVNWATGGSRRLTDQQIRRLKEKYDVEYLTEDECFALLEELAYMDAVSDNDPEKNFLKKETILQKNS